MEEPTVNPSRSDSLWARQYLDNPLESIQLLADISGKKGG